MNASVNIERNSWRLPPDETVQVADPRSKSAQVKEVNRSADSPSDPYPNRVFLVDYMIRFKCMQVFRVQSMEDTTAVQYWLLIRKQEIELTRNQAYDKEAN